MRHKCVKNEFNNDRAKISGAWLSKPGQMPPFDKYKRPLATYFESFM